MKRTILLAALVALVAGGLPVFAAHHEDEGDGEKRFEIDGQIRTRWDFSENVFDADDDTDDALDLWPYRADISAHGHFGHDVHGVVHLNTHGFFGDDDPQRNFPHPIGQFTGASDANDITLYQAYIDARKVFGSNWSLRFGRQEFTFGNELQMGDLDFYAGQSFDGIRASADWEKVDLDLIHFEIDANEAMGIPFGGGSFDGATTLTGGIVNFGLPLDSELEPYVLFSRSNGGTSPMRTRIYTLGVLWQREPVEDSLLDWSVEVAAQTGEMGPSGSEIDVAGTILEGWIGFNVGDGHRLHAGALFASGDDGSDPTETDAYMPLFPDNHSYNRLGDLDLFGGPSVGVTGGITNITDLNVGWGWQGERNGVRASIHNLTLSEEVGGQDEIGNELDVVYSFRYSKHLGFEAGVAYLAAGDLVEAAFAPGDDVMRTWWQVHLKF